MELNTLLKTRLCDIDISNYKIVDTEIYNLSFVGFTLNIYERSDDLVLESSKIDDETVVNIKLLKSNQRVDITFNDNEISNVILKSSGNKREITDYSLTLETALEAI